MFRPEPDDLASRGTLNTNALTVTTGNPGLNPFRSWNLDASAEYYFKRDGLVSLALFYKDIQSFIVPNVPTGDTVVVDGTSYVVVGPINGTGGSLWGAEFGVQTSLRDIVPSPFDGLGFVFNYTFIDDNTKARGNASTGLPVGLPDVSRHSLNFIGYYEKGPFSARLAYNWRSSFLQADRSSGALNTFTDDYGSLDGRIAYNITPKIELSFEAKNITNSAVRGYAESKDRLTEYYNFGRRFFIGVRAKF
jgi:TonB-dependent receptor